MIALANIQGFPKSVRIVKTDDFSSVFSLRKRIHGQFLVLHYATLHNDSGLSVEDNNLTLPKETIRFAVVNAKKVTKLAVERNYMKRVLRELFRQELQHLKTQALGEFTLDIIVRTQKTFKKQDYTAVKAEFLSLLQRLIKRVNQHAVIEENGHVKAVD